MKLSLSERNDYFINVTTEQCIRIYLIIFLEITEALILSKGYSN